MAKINRIFIRDKSTNNIWYLCNINDVSNTSTSAITQYPTVSGGKISDHYYEEPKKLSFTIMFSRFIPSNVYYVDKTTGKTQYFNQTGNYDLDKFKSEISRWKSEGVRLDIVTNEERYTNMVINSISSSENKNTYGMWNPTINLQEVREANVAYAQINIDTTTPESASLTIEQELGVALDSTKQGDIYADAFFTEMFGSNYKSDVIYNMEVPN